MDRKHSYSKSVISVISVICPQCGSSKSFKDGLRYLADGSQVQRWLCRSCFYRFSESKDKINVPIQCGPFEACSDLAKAPMGKRNLSGKEV